MTDDDFLDDCLFFRIEGRLIPAVRMTRRSKFVDPRAQAYLASKTDIQYQLKAQMVEKDYKILAGQTPLGVVIAISYTNRLHKNDLDNVSKNLMDSMQGIVYQNDCWIDVIRATRKLGKRDETIIGIWEIR
jgi:Holliday junction resolvase RusA-like endonuclease